MFSQSSFNTPSMVKVRRAMRDQMKNQMNKPVSLYDTTLRDGTQRKGLSLSLEDKLRISRLLDDFGLHYIEGGWPGSNPKDFEYFSRVKGLHLTNSKVTAFGST